MTISDFQICANNGRVIEISRDLFERFPKDSFLYNLLKEDQMMSTRNGSGQYMLTLDHPELLEAVLTHFETGELPLREIYLFAKKEHECNVADTMKSLALTFNYLGFPLPQDFCGFVEGSEISCVTDVADVIYREAELQICDLAIQLCRRMVQKNDLYLQSFLDVSWARFKKETEKSVSLKMKITVRSCQIHCEFQRFNNETPSLSLNLKSLGALMKHSHVFMQSPVCMLAQQNEKAFYELIKEHFVPVLISIFCQSTKTSIENMSTELRSYEKGSNHHYVDIKLTLKL
ncbi:hypothetical protein MP638_002160 [Amoeboaphelidium occidentale]|nr:hypothetical protein MP638_002160 [Amoeboaphelidium occidentale]